LKQRGVDASYPLILRSRASGVSKDEANIRGLMVRDGAFAPPHHEDSKRLIASG